MGKGDWKFLTITNVVRVGMEERSEIGFPATFFILFFFFVVLFYALFSRNFRRRLNQNLIVLREDRDNGQPYRAAATPMVRVSNPFYLEMDDQEISSLRGGVKMLIRNQRPCTVICYWGLDIELFYRILYSRKELADIHRLLSRQALETTHPLHLEVSQGDGEWMEFRPLSSEDELDLGPMPRSRYPLVITLSQTDQYHYPWDRHPTHIVCLVSVLHLPDVKHEAAAFPVALLALTNTGSISQLKTLYMSGEKSSPGQPVIECVVCQSLGVDRALLPCRHVCVCERCFPRLKTCPMCRHSITSYLQLTSDEGGGGDVDSQGEDELGAAPAGWAARLEAFCIRINRWLGFE